MAMLGIIVRQLHIATRTDAGAVWGVTVSASTRDGPAEAEGLGRLTERVLNVRPNFGRMLCARMKQRLLLVSALSG